MRYFPINVDVAGRKVLVIGGGRVASRKVATLRACGADVTVVSPAFCTGLARMKGIRRIRRGYRKTDMRGAWLVVSAAGPKAVNRRAWEHATEAGTAINVVDQPELCTFTVPAVVQRQELLITISTGGGSPALAGRIRRLLSEAIGPEFGRHLTLLGQMREIVKSSGLPLDDRGRLLKAMAADDVREIIDSDGVGAARRHCLAMKNEALRRHASASPAEDEDVAGSG